jgi:hypothetical protein
VIYFLGRLHREKRERRGDIYAKIYLLATGSTNSKRRLVGDICKYFPRNMANLLQVMSVPTARILKSKPYTSGNYQDPKTHRHS